MQNKNKNIGYTQNTECGTLEVGVFYWISSVQILKIIRMVCNTDAPFIMHLLCARIILSNNSWINFL
jgi:hypothetical protein